MDATAIGRASLSERTILAGREVFLGRRRGPLAILPFVGPAVIASIAYTWVRGAGAHAAEVATDNPLNSLVFGIDRSAKHSKIIDTRVFQ
jgi:hypothetical protein